MTIGNRIAKLRKDNNLSQEEFGKDLGVTRQAISKWEADASIPDVDKLVQISKKYNVTVGWILGLEESTTETDEIIKKTLNATKKKRSNLTYILLGIAGCFVIFTFGYTITRLLGLNQEIRVLQSEVNNYTGRVSSIENSLNYQINELYENLETIITNQSSIISAFTVDYVDSDLTNNKITYRVSFVPKEYKENMKFEAIVSSDGTTYNIECNELDNHYFEAIIEVELTDKIDFFVYLDAEEGVTQFLKSITDEYYNSKARLYNYFNETRPTDYYDNTYINKSSISESGMDMHGSYPALSEVVQFYDKQVKVETFSLNVYLDGVRQKVKITAVNDNYYPLLEGAWHYSYETLMDIDEKIEEVEIVVMDNFGRYYSFWVEPKLYNLID